MAPFHELAKRWPRVVLLAIVIGLAYAGVANAVVLNLQTARLRARSDTYVRCQLYASHNYPKVGEPAVSTGSCFGISVSPCKFTILSAKKAKCWTEFHTHQLPLGRNIWFCSQMLYFRLAKHKKPKPKYDTNDMFIYARSRQSCDNVDGPS